MDPNPLFHPFDPSHLAALGSLLLLGALIAWLSRHSPERHRWIGRLLAVALVSYGVVTYLQKGMAHQLTIDYALPLELCEWVLFACIISLLRPNQFTSEIAYFWGLAGTLQATLTPDIYHGFPSWEFVEFFWIHGGILLAIVYMIAGQGFKPRKGSVLRMMIALNVWAVCVGAIDWLFHWDYGYLCWKPAEPSLLDYMGPWPWYLLSGEAIALASFLLLTLPWKIRRKHSKAG